MYDLTSLIARLGLNYRFIWSDKTFPTAPKVILHTASNIRFSASELFIDMPTYQQTLHLRLNLHQMGTMHYNNSPK